MAKSLELELNEVDVDRLKALLKYANYYADTAQGRREITSETIIFLQRLRKSLKDYKTLKIMGWE